MKITEIHTNPNNPRLIKDHRFKKLVQSIKEFPKMMELRPIIIDNENMIIGGNMRYNALKELKYKDIPGEWIKSAETLTDDEKRRFVIADNVNFGEHDWDLLANEWNLDELKEWGVDMPDFESESELTAEDDDFEVPNEIKTDIVLGDLYEIGEHRLICGDSTDSDAVAKLMNGDKADMVFTSPPYNANTRFNKGNKINNKNLGKLYENYNDNKDSKEYIDFASSVLENCFLFTNGWIFWNVNYNTNSKNEYIKQILNRIDYLQETICWKKTALPVPAGLTRTWEPIFCFNTELGCERIGTLNKIEFNFWEISNLGSLDKTHRAAYPVKLVEKAINLTNAKSILDTFLGSGSTMVAAHQLKRKCYGMEIDPKYCQLILDRMKKLDSTLIIKKNGKVI